MSKYLKLRSYNSPYNCKTDVLGYAQYICLGTTKPSHQKQHPEQTFRLRVSEPLAFRLASGESAAVKARPYGNLIRSLSSVICRGLSCSRTWWAAMFVSLKGIPSWWPTTVWQIAWANKRGKTLSLWKWLHVGPIKLQ